MRINLFIHSTKFVAILIFMLSWFLSIICLNSYIGLVFGWLIGLFICLFLRKLFSNFREITPLLAAANIILFIYIAVKFHLLH